jgi:hypothetical protein
MAVEPGQVYCDKDKRSSNRLLTVQTVVDGVAHCASNTGKDTKVKVERLEKPKSFELVAQQSLSNRDTKGTITLKNNVTGETNDLLPLDATADQVAEVPSLIEVVSSKRIRRAQAEVDRLEAVYRRRLLKAEAASFPSESQRRQRKARNAYIKLNQAKARLEQLTKEAS